MVTNVWGVTAMALGTACLLLASQGPQPARVGPVRRRLGWIGRTSYELYLFHLVGLAAMRTLVAPERIAPGAVLPWLLVYLAVSIGCAAGVARWVSEPANRAIRRALAPRPVPAVAS